MKPSGWWKRKRRNVWMTSVMFAVLQFLRAAKKEEFPFIKLPGVHTRTINSLTARDWIFASPGLDGIRYKITANGERWLKIFEQPTRRYDGICPTCGIRPKHVYATGYRSGWCYECEQEYRNFRYRKGMDRLNPDRLCSCCKQRPLHHFPGGKLSTYCTECRQAKRKAEKRAQHDRDLARIAAGEILLCRACKKEPRCCTERYVRDYCPTCQKQYMDEYNARRRSQAVAS